MKVLHVSSSYPLTSGDGTAPFMEEMLSALNDAGHEVRVVVPRISGLAEGWRNGVEVIGARYAPKPFQVWGYGRSVKAQGAVRAGAAVLTPLALSSMALSLRAQIRQNRPDLVHLHWILPQGALTSVVPHEVPIVVSVHGADARLVDGPLGPLARHVANRADALVAASSTVLERLQAAVPSAHRKSHIILHGASSSVFGTIDRVQARADLNLEPDVPVIVGVGRLVRKKGFGWLVQSATALEAVGAHIYLVGEGPDRARLEGLVKAGAESNIHLLGAKSRVEVGRWMAAADVVVIPGDPATGDMDSGPVVLMEALAAGRPVVATRIGMVPDLIRDGVNGYMIDQARPDRIAAAVQLALENRDALEPSARRTFDEVGDWSRVAQELSNVYETAASERRSALAT